MGRSKETFGKKEVRNKKEKKRKDKEKRRLEKKEQGKKGDLDDMIAWVDEDGLITSTPPDLTKKKKEIKAESIEIGVPKSEFRINNKIRTGVLRNYNDMKGFGFIMDSESNESIFVHNNDCDGELRTGCKVEFEIEKGLKGLKAVNVKII
jgi:cold shock CspA family protein